MKKTVQQIFEPLVPFIILGVAIALIIGLLIMLSYVLVWGIVLGGILWLAVIVKNLLFPPHTADKNEGRVIEHDKPDNKD